MRTPRDNSEPSTGEEELNDLPAAMDADEGDDTSTLPDRRTAPRFMFQVPVLIRSGQQSGRGKVHDMSSTGVRIENSNLEPTEGSRIRLGFRFFTDSPAVELSGEVIRKTETGGFCVHFGKIDPRTRRALTTLLPKLGTGRLDQDATRLFTGELVIRVGPTVHRACAEAAQAAGTPLNDWIKQRLGEAATVELGRARNSSPQDDDDPEADHDAP